MPDNKKNHPFLKDKVANIIFSDEECRDYVVSIVAASLEIDREVISKNLVLVSNRVNTNVNTAYNYADNVYKNDTDIINIEINYNESEKTNVKNARYICHLLLKQSKKHLTFLIIYENANTKKCTIIILKFCLLIRQVFFFYQRRVDQCQLKQQDLIKRK